MAPGPGIVCQKLPNRTVVPCWRLLEEQAGHMSHMKEAVLSLKCCDGRYDLFPHSVPLHFVVITV